MKKIVGTALALAALPLAACGQSETAGDTENTDAEEEQAAEVEMTERDEQVVELMGHMVGQPMNEFLPFFGAQFVVNVLEANGVQIDEPLDRVTERVAEHFEPYERATLAAFGGGAGEYVSDENLAGLTSMAGNETGASAITCVNMRSNGREPAFAPCEGELGITFDKNGRAALNELFEGTVSVLGDEQRTAGIALAMCRTADDLANATPGANSALTFETLEIQFTFGDRLPCPEWQRRAEAEFGG